MLNFHPYTFEQLVKDRQEEIRRNVEALRAANGLAADGQQYDGQVFDLMERIQALFDGAADAAGELRDTVEMVCVAIAQEPGTAQPVNGAALSTQEIKRRLLAERIAAHHAMYEIEERAAQQWQ